MNQQPQPDLEKAKADLERLQSEMAASQHVNNRLREDLAKTKQQSKVRLRIAAVVLMVAALFRLAWLASQNPSPAIQPPATLSVPVAPSAELRSVASSTEALDAPAAQALDRLIDALRSMPEEDQVQLIAKINAGNPADTPACPLSWNSGIPSLSLGGKKGQAPTMSAALNQCAAAVEKYHLEKATLDPR